MKYKKILFGFGITNSILLFFLIFSFLNYQEKISETSVSPHNSASKVSYKTSPDAGTSLVANENRKQVWNFIFILATSLSLLPFLVFVTIISKKFKKYRKRQKELIHVNKNKDLFFSIISHDLKSPAQNIIALSDLICKSPGALSPQETDKINQLIHTCANKHYELLNNLLDWSKTQFTGQHLIKNHCVIADLVEENITAQGEKVKEKKIEISNRIGKDVQLFSNEIMLNTVFRNILNNALKFTPEEGKISFYSKSNKKTLDIYIEDNGMGMSPQTLKNLFDIKYLRSLRGTNKEKGSGIGLILCKEVIEKLNGEIKVLSSEKNGSIFILRLPWE